MALKGMARSSLIFRFRAAMLLFLAGLVLSGITAFPLLQELRLLSRLLGVGAVSSGVESPGLVMWIHTVQRGLEDIAAHYSWMSYGTDWLAFGHLVIALFFIAPLVNPLSARANIYAGLVACAGVFPLALICGAIRGVPFPWRLIDCTFGVIGALPLLYCLRVLRQLEAGNSRFRPRVSLES